MGWPLIIDITPITTRCPTGDGQSGASICGEQTVCEDWPTADTFPVRILGLPPIGVTCSCKPSARVHGTSLEEMHLAPYSAQWHRTAMAEFYGSTLSASCRLDMHVQTVEHKSDTVSLTLQKGEERTITFTLTVSGQGHVPGATYGWRVLTPPFPFGSGRHHIDACHGVRYGPEEYNPNLEGACVFTPDGEIIVHDANSAGDLVAHPLRVLTAASTVGGHNLGVEQSIGIDMLLSAKRLRETRPNKPYKFSLFVEGAVDIPQNLTIDITLFVAAQIVTSLSTFVPPAPVLPPQPPALPPSLPAALPSGTCICRNDCPRAYDGVCDDDGPGGIDMSNNERNVCTLGEDCADCGPRRIPAGSLVVSPDPGVAGSSVTMDELRVAQLECVPEHTGLVTGGMPTVDRIGIDGVTASCAKQWVPGRYNFLAGRLPDELCSELGSSMRAVRISTWGCGEYSASPCHACCIIPAPPAPPSSPPAMPGICENTCEYAGSRGCNDGGPGSEFSTCAYGTDCEGRLHRQTECLT